VLLDAASDELVFMDPFREVELRRVAAAVPLSGGLVGGGALGTLFAIDNSNQIVQLNAQSGAIISTFASPGTGLTGLALVDGLLLVSDDSGNVFQLDPGSMTVLGTLSVPENLAALGADGGGGVAQFIGGDYQPFVSTILDDESALSITEGVGPFSGRFRPIEPLSTFDETNVRGNWLLEVQDTASGNTGVLHDWTLFINEPQDTAPDIAQTGMIGDSTDMARAAADDVDIYRFDIQVGGTITVDVLPQGGLNAVIRLFDAQGNALVSVDAAGIDGAEQLIHVADDAAAFFVGISSSGNMAYSVIDGSGAGGGTTTGSYALELRFSEPISQDDDNSSFDTATPIGVLGAGGQRIRGEIRSAPFTVPLPGSNDEPGHRHIQPESHLIAGGSHGHVHGQILLAFRDDVSPEQRAAILAEQGLEVIKSFDFIDGMLVRLRNQSDTMLKIHNLRGMSEIRYAEPDSLHQKTLVPNDPLFVNQWHYDNQGQTGGTFDADVDLPEAWDTFTGSAQTVIAIVDSGVDYNHPDLAANMWINPGEIPGNGIDDDGNGYIDDVFGIDTGDGNSNPFDVDGHGTHVAGTTSAVGNNGVGVSGINWNAKIMALKIFPDGGGGAPTSAIIEAMNYIVTMKTIYGINIVVSNNSYGGAGFSQAFQDAIESSINAGIPFVAAAGNFGIDNDATPFYPASYPLEGIISVAASDHNDDFASFSHYGFNSVDIAAPGVNVLSTTPGGTYSNFNGTSMASPHVAGAVALLAGFAPNATVAQLKSAILLGGDPLPNMTGLTVTGARLNVANSLSLIGAGVTGPAGGAVRTAFYNFQDVYGTLPSGATAVNAITEIQKQRAREIFEFYSNLTGIEFVESANEGLTVVTGDLRVLDPTVPTGPGGVVGISNGSLAGMVIMDAAENWGDSEYGGGWFQTAMHEIGHSMGIGHTYDLPNLTIMGGFGVGEPVFPGDHDIVHARHLHPPASLDMDLYAFTLPQDGYLTAETIAERLSPNASLLNTSITVYRDLGNGNRRKVASNDDYFSNDSYLRLHLERGSYLIGVNASNNAEMDPSVSDMGFGGTSQGDYELVLGFEPDLKPGIVDTDDVELDGNQDGSPGGRYSFFFESGPTIFVDKMADTASGPQGNGSLASPFDNIRSATELARSRLVMPRDGAARVVDGENFVVSDGVNFPVRFEFDSNGFVSTGSIGVPINAEMTPAELAEAVAAAIQEAATSDPVRLNVSVTVEGALVNISGAVLVDASGSPRLLESPSIVRIVGNGGADRNLATLSDNRPYLIGVDGTTPLADGMSLDVPQGVTVMIDAGALFKMSEANVDVGTSAEGVDRRAGALQVLGTPQHNVFFRSYRNDTVGGDSDGPGPAASAGDWGGLVFRSDSDQEESGVFLNRVNHATLVRGGGKLLVESVEETFTPIHLIGSRPTISHNTIRRSADAAISADPASFEESLGRVGPDIHGNLIVENSINGLFVRIQTQLGSSIDQIVRPSRWDDTDIVHVLTENLQISATPGGPIKDPVTGIIHARLDGSLKIDPGVVVKLEGARIETLLGAQLIAEGTAVHDVVFTALTDDSYGGSGTFDTKNDGSATGPAPGQWGGLFFAAMAKGSLDHVELAYAGGLTPIAGNFAQFNAIEVHQADVRITNSLIRDNSDGTSVGNRNGRGSNAPATVFVRGAQPIIVNNLFQDNAGTVVHINANSLQARRQPDTGRQTGQLARFEEFDDNHGPLVRLNRLENNGFNGMEIRGAVLTTESVWDDTDIAHILRGEITVLNHHTFSGLHLLSTDSESLVVKLSGPEAGFRVDGTPLDIDDRIGGSIYIGGRGLPVVLTSLADDTAIAGVDGRGLPLGDTNNDGDDSSAAPGDWRGITLEQYSNDRNVATWREREPAFIGQADRNRVPVDAEFLGNLAPGEKSGDVNRRLGFEVRGNISLDNPRDVDVYSFSGVAGTEVFLDVDETSHSLDSVIELIDATGTVLARSIDASVDNLSGAAFPLLKFSHLGHDFFSTSKRDAGMRVILPGATGTTNTYFVRVRSLPADGQIENLNGGLTRGNYRLQIRLRQVDEKPGSYITGADIRYATIGIEALGLPKHSQLTGESHETRAANDTLATAQPLGNLLTSDRNAISVGGNITTSTDVDWYSFQADYDLIQAIAGFNSGGKTFATIFDIDYADGLSRPDTVLSVFDGNGNLVMVSRDSNVEDDLPGVGQGADTADLSRGSFGTHDPFIGSVQLPAGVIPAGSTTTYYVAISSNSQLPTALNGNFTSGASNTLVRLEPMNSLQRIAEDHIGFQGYRSGNFNGGANVLPTSQLFDISNSVSLSTNVVPFTLNDVVLYTVQGGTNGLRTVNPFAGNLWYNVGNIPVNAPLGFVGDLAMRNDGRMFMLQALTGAAGDNTAGQLVELDPATGAQTVIGNDGIPDVNPATDPPDPQELTSPGADAMAWLFTGFDGETNNYDLYYSVRGARRGPDVSLNSSTLYRVNPANGSAAIVEGEPWGVRGEIYQSDPGDLGRTTGMAFIGGTLFGVSDRGFFYQINTGSGRASNVVSLGGSFSGLAPGPQNLQGGAFANMMFATTTSGQIFAINTAGQLQSVFQNGTSATSPTAPAGLAFSPLDFNLWHPTERRTGDAGHGINPAFDNSRDPGVFERNIGSDGDLRESNEAEGGLSFYFGFETWEMNPVDADAYIRYNGINAQHGILNGDNHRALSNNPIIGNNYNLPGGALGSLRTQAISLAGYTASDKPTLYFNYFLETQNRNSITEMRDSARVLVSPDGGNSWQLLATNNSILSPVGRVYELPSFLSPSVDASTHPRQQVQELFDNTGGWRQARVDLSNYAGVGQLQFRFDFSTAGAMVGPNGTTQPGDPSTFGSLNDEERGLENNFEGFYVDDVIIGFSERGEIVTNSAVESSFFTIPQNPNAADPSQILTGSYQLEIRRGTEFGDVVDNVNPDIFIFQTFDTNDRLISEVFRLGDSNLHRDQGQLLIANNTISHSLEFGIVVDAAARDAGDSLTYPGGVRNLPTLNNDRLTAGVKLENNIIGNFGLGGIRFSGDPNAGNSPLAAVPFGRIMNNTIYGGEEAAGVGIQVTDNASPTILNNIIANTVDGLTVDASSSSTVIGANLFQGNTSNGTIGQNAIVLPDGAPLFVDAAGGNFYLAPGSLAIDSSLNSLADRPSFEAVNSPLGIPASPILAPDRDRYGQLRLDDPGQDPPPGLGSNIFKDRGAVERADFRGPTARLIDPFDNDGLGADLNPQPNQVLIVATTINRILIQLQDAGIGVDDSSVSPGSVRVFLDDQLLVEGEDYEFVYNATNNQILLRALANNGPVSQRYDVLLENSGSNSIRDLADNSLAPNKPEGTTHFVIITGGTPPGELLPVFTLASQEVVALEDNEQELGIDPDPTVIPDFATDLPSSGGIGDPTILIATVSVSNPGLFLQQPTIGLDGTLSFKTAADQNGSSEVVVRAVETGVANPRQSPPQTFTITLEAVNDAPNLSIPSTIGSFEDAGLVTITGFAQDFGPGPITAIDEVNQNVTVTTTAMDPSLFVVQPTIDTNGNLTFQTIADFNSTMGEVIVTVFAEDDGPGSAPNVNRTETKTFTINVAPINDPPSFSLTENQIVVSEDGEEQIGIARFEFPGFAKDMVPGPPTATDEVDQTLSFVLFTTAQHLFAEQPAIDTSGTLSFRTAPDRAGTAIVAVQLIDSGPGLPPPNDNTSDPVTFTISITPVNDPPQFTIPAGLTVQEDSGSISQANFATGIRPGPVGAVDESGQAVTFEVEALDPASFEIQPSISVGGTLSFRTAANANSDNADFRVRVRLRDDGPDSPPPNNNQSEFQTFTVTVEPVNDPPLPGAFTTGAIEDQAIVIQPSSILALAQPGPTPDETEDMFLSQVEPVTASGGNITPVFDGSAIVSLTYTPAENFVGTDTFLYVISDLGSPSRHAAGTATIVVEGVNDAPQFTMGSNRVVDEDSGPVSFNNWATNIAAGPASALDELASQSVSFTVTALNPGLFATQPSVAADGTLTFEPATDANGTSQVVVVAVDDGPEGGSHVNASQPRTFTITVRPINDPPVFTAGSNIVVDEDSGAYSESWATGIAPAAGLLNAPPTAIDEAGQIVDFSIMVDRPELFQVQPNISSDGVLNFTPASNAHGTAVLSVTAVDRGPMEGANQNRSETRTVTITIVGVNDPPVAVNDEFDTNENQVLQVAAPGLLANDKDVDLPDDTLSAVPLTTTSKLGAVVVVSADGSFSYDPTAVTLIQQLSAGQSVADSFVYRIRDAEGALSGDATVTINVEGIDDPPVAVDDSYSVGIGQAATLDVLTNDSDIDSAIDPGSVTITSLPILGTASVLADGRIQYTPTAGSRGVETIGYTVRDVGGNLSNEAFVTITINNAPQAVDDSSFTFKNVPVEIDVLANDSDIDGSLDPDSVQVVVAPGAGGTTEVLAGGIIRFTPAEDFSGDVTFSYVVADNVGTVSNVANVLVRIQKSQWQNPNGTLDVNNDSFVTPIDALFVVNYINSGGEAFLPDAGFAPPPYLDTNGDEFVTPVDALLVINFLNSISGGGGAEGEASWDSQVDVMPVTPQQMLQMVGPVALRGTHSHFDDSLEAALEDEVLELVSDDVELQLSLNDGQQGSWPGFWSSGLPLAESDVDEELLDSLSSAVEDSALEQALNDLLSEDA
jgi:VCBS repeat-containing protein